MKNAFIYLHKLITQNFLTFTWLSNAPQKTNESELYVIVLVAWPYIRPHKSIFFKNFNYFKSFVYMLQRNFCAIFAEMSC